MSELFQVVNIFDVKEVACLSIGRLTLHFLPSLITDFKAIKGTS